MLCKNTHYNAYLDPTQHRGDCPSGWEAFGTSCYFLSDEKLNWFNSEAKCAEQPKTHLASCLSSAEWAFINKLKSSGDYFHWMGQNDIQVQNMRHIFDSSAMFAVPRSTTRG